MSFNSAVPIDYTQVGYGTAASNMYRSLLELGHTVTLDDRTAPIQIHWKQPHLVQPTSDYNILYFPWESTQFRTGWLDICNGTRIDEIFTTSDWCKKVFEDIGVEKKITVYPHGIQSVWKPKRRRKRKGPLKYLIVDAEANRKGWQEAFDAFRDVFGTDRSRATLTIKTRQRCYARWFDEHRRVHSPAELPNVTIDISKKSEEEMVAMFRDHDVMIYPSYGEGFGLIPFQFLATGGIAITTGEWCHYEKYLGDFSLRSTYGTTKWQGEHPGEVCYPDVGHLRELVKKSYDEFEEQVPKQFKLATEMHQEYDWTSLTREAFSHVEDAVNTKYDAK